MEIEIFVTNISDKKEFSKIKTAISKITSDAMVTIDLDDKDKVLRVEAESVDPEKIISTVRDYNFRCREMAD